MQLFTLQTKPARYIPKNVDILFLRPKVQKKIGYN